MLRENFEHGLPESVWSNAKEEARRAMIDAARRRGVISYSELVGRVTSCRLEPHDLRLAHMLGEISSEEDDAGRGLLTVVVVHKSGDMKPGSGFFTLARSRGRETADWQRFWLEELERVYEAWSK